MRWPRVESLGAGGGPGCPWACAGVWGGGWGSAPLWLPQVAGGLWWEEAAVVSVQLRGRDGQPCGPGAREGGESRAVWVGQIPGTRGIGVPVRTAPS